MSIVKSAPHSGWFSRIVRNWWEVNSHCRPQAHCKCCQCSTQWRTWLLTKWKWWEAGIPGRWWRAEVAPGFKPWSETGRDSRGSRHFWKESLALPTDTMVRSPDWTGANPSCGPLPRHFPGHSMQWSWHSWRLTSYFPWILPNAMMPAHFTCGNLAFYRQKKYTGTKEEAIKMVNKSEFYSSCLWLQPFLFQLCAHILWTSTCERSQV
jgi:hypothetical protein